MRTDGRAAATSKRTTSSSPLTTERLVLKLDQPSAGGLDHSLQLGVGSQLLDDVTDVRQL
jgi:hypothetical protein